MYLTSWKSVTVTLLHSRQPRELSTYSPGHSPWRRSEQILFLKVNFWLFTPRFYTSSAFNEQRKPASRSLTQDSLNRPKETQKVVFCPQIFAFVRYLLPQDIDTRSFLLLYLPTLLSTFIFRDYGAMKKNICKNKNKYLLSICFVSGILCYIFSFHNSNNLIYIVSSHLYTWGCYK